VNTHLQPLSKHRIRELVILGREPAARELAREIYRLHSVIRRAALLVNTIKQRNSDAALDITSKILLAGMDEALRNEPAVIEPGASAVCPPAGCAAVRRPAAPAAESDLNEAEALGLVDNENHDDTRQRLFTWKLIPQPGRGDSGWTVSPYRGIAIVRAYDPVQARTLVASKFKLSTEAGIQAPESPWERKSLVRCELFEDPAYDHIHAAAVVYP
jgi:hypothetical protein